MNDEQALNLADHLEDLAALLTQKAERIRKTVQPHTSKYITPLNTPLMERIQQQVDPEESIGAQASPPEGAGYGRKRWLP